MAAIEHQGDYRHRVVIAPAVIVLHRCSVLVIMSVVGCSGQSKPADLPTAPIVSQAAVDAVRTAIAEQFRIDASNIDMNKPLSEPPYKADELDLVELVMEIEERLDVSRYRTGSWTSFPAAEKGFLRSGSRRPNSFPSPCGPKGASKIESEKALTLRGASPLDAESGLSLR